MKTIALAALMLVPTHYIMAQITNPVTHFQSLDSRTQPVIKWDIDINGDGKNEMFLSLKDEHDQDVALNLSPSWFVYIADGVVTSYKQSTGIKEQGEDEIGATVPMIDIKVCFVGLVSELGRHAIVTEQIDNPRVGEPIARIYAYTVEGDHLKRTKLTEYNPMQSNVIFDKYLKDDKRTIITPVEVN
jgi:hypothetical protein